MAEYIEREALIKAIKVHETAENDRIETGYNWALDDIEEIVKQMPAADVQPIRRGHWEDSGNFYFKKCSECGSRWDISITNNCFAHYCPRCGADMREERDPSCPESND